VDQSIFKRFDECGCGHGVVLASAAAMQEAGVQILHDPVYKKIENYISLLYDLR
jgi:hypothetical protein